MEVKEVAQVGPASGKRLGDDLPPSSYVSRRVSKNFAGQGNFGGEVTSYDVESELFEIEYQDGDSETIELEKVLSILLPLSPEAGSGQVEEAAPAPKSKAKNAAKKAAPAKKAVGKVPKAVSTGRQRPPQPSAAGNNRSETAPPAKKAVLGVGSQIEFGYLLDGVLTWCPGTVLYLLPRWKDWASVAFTTARPTR